MKSKKSVIVLLLMLSLTEALLNGTSTYFRSRKILRLRLSNKFEMTGIIEATEISVKGNRTSTKPIVIWKESCFLVKSDLTTRNNCQILDFHYTVEGEYYKNKYSTGDFTLLNSSKNETNCQVSMEIDGKYLGGLRSAVVSKRKFLNGEGHGSSITKTAKDSKYFKSNTISRKQRVSDSGKRTIAELRENRYKRRITVLSKSIKYRNRMAVRRHHERMKTILKSVFRMCLDRRMAANVRNQKKGGPLEIITHLRTKVLIEIVNMSRRRNLQIRTQVRVNALRDSYSRRNKGDDSKDTTHMTVINEVRNENKKYSQKRVFQLRSQVKVKDNMKRRIFQSNTEVRGDCQQIILLLGNETRQVVGEVLQRRIFKSRKEVRVSRERKLSKMRNEVINEIENIRRKGISQAKNEIRKIVRGRSHRIFQSKHELRNTISSARTPNVETKKGADGRLETTRFNEARSSFKRNAVSSYFNPGEDVRNTAFGTISESEDNAINGFMIEGAHINMDFNGRNTRRLFNTRDLRQLIRNRSENPFLQRNAINRRMPKRAHISSVGMRKRQSTGMSLDNRYFFKRKSFVYLRYQTVGKLARNKHLIELENLANRGNMINQSKERRSRKKSTRECRNSEKLISLRQFSSMSNLSEILSNTELRNVTKIILHTNRTSQRFSKISEQETFANSLSTSTQRYANIVALSAEQFGKRMPVSIFCCRLIQKFENESPVNSVNSKRLLNLSDSDLNKWPRLTDTDQNYSGFADLIPVTRIQLDGNLITSLGLAMTSLY